MNMEPLGIDHGWVVDELTAMFPLGDKVAVRTQGALRVDDWNWIVDVQKMVLHVQRASDAATVPQAIVLAPSTSVSLHALPGVEVDLSSLAPE